MDGTPRDVDGRVWSACHLIRGWIGRLEDKGRRNARGGRDAAADGSNEPCIDDRAKDHGGRADLSREAPFLPQLLLAEGYTTCAIDNLVQTRHWFRRGFEYYIDPSLRRPLSLCVEGEELNARALPWLRQHRDERFFLLVHYWDPHYPLTPPARFQHLGELGFNKQVDWPTLFELLAAVGSSEVKPVVD